jgi:hypothetical protein
MASLDEFFLKVETIGGWLQVPNGGAEHTRLKLCLLLPIYDRFLARTEETTNFRLKVEHSVRDSLPIHDYFSWRNYWATKCLLIGSG